MSVKYAPFIDLFTKLKYFDYGITIDERNVNPDDGAFMHYYHYLSPEEFMENKCGVCWDYVSFQSWYFKTHLSRYKFKNYYIELRDNERSTHTFTILNLGDEYLYFEMAYYSVRGIYVSNNLENIFNWILHHMISDKGYTQCFYTLREFKEYINYGCDAITYMDDMNKMPIVKTGLFKVRYVDFQELRKVY